MKDEKVMKALHYGRPFIFEKDYEDVRELRYRQAGQRIKRRGWLILAVAVIAAAFFLMNGMFRIFAISGDVGLQFLFLTALWFVMAAACLLYGVRFLMRLSKTGRWLISQ